ncbi:MAG: T9SS type A sorting domain-containing protein, partial [Candidatus Poribacteria bacterium]|nr:T9SS type A sorting domain-containing protein [Candidatus Poribacteria bacterium]
VQAKTYKTGEKIPISLTATLTFSGKHTLGGTVYTCVSDGECVVSYGILTKGEIEVSTVSTPSASDSPGMSDAKAVVGAANRPVMYWIAGGGLYRLAGASAEQIAERATDVAVGSDKLYWIEQTSETRGAIHHANLDGSDAAVVKTLTSVPKGVALANGKLYITNGWGKIQRMNVDGTQFETNFLTNLGAPLGIAVSGSRVYWTDGSGRVRSAPLQGTKAIQNIVTGSGTLGGIVADGSKVYWTEQTGERSGRIRAANLDGTGITDAYTVTATVHGLALDPGNQQLYWTNGWGKVQRGVRGSRYQDVVTGLMTPTALAIGGANTATPMPATKPVQPAAEPNYDVDGSGTVDNADLFLVSLAVGTDNAKYDVNGDGTVNDKDIALVRDNRDNGAAAAPMVVGVKLTAEQVGRLQAQIDLLIVSGDRSPAALKTLVYLQQLIATARPEQTQLLANYPNPFNPETWIPYELATDTDVRITIYAANGVVVRTLQLGQQSAGYYTDRERAAYWDGRNASGEQVASGVYFYQLETDEISSLRKMVILK